MHQRGADGWPASIFDRQGTSDFRKQGLERHNPYSRHNVENILVPQCVVQCDVFGLQESAEAGLDVLCSHSMNLEKQGTTSKGVEAGGSKDCNDEWMAAVCRDTRSGWTDWRQWRVPGNKHTSQGPLACRWLVVGLRRWMRAKIQNNPIAWCQSLTAWLDQGKG